MTPERWARLKDIFDRALAVETQVRGDFVRSECGGDGTLARSVVALLNHHDVEHSIAGEVLTGQALQSLLGDALRTFVPGEIVAGRFQIERFLAEGGMGEVYAARDLELTETVALKTVQPALAADERMLTLFKQEIQLARKVTHRNVSRVFDLFRHDPDGSGQRSVMFVSMELLVGDTLAERIRAGPVPIAQATTIALQLVDGLDAAHSAGIIHHDFKSGNIVLVPEQADGDGTSERVVIMDFGLASTLAPNTIEVLPASPAGTPAYMAPEQVAGEPITAAADIYSLGVVLFELISGTLPFRGNSPLETARLRLDHPAPSLRSVAPNAPPAWDRTVRACLQRHPSARPASAREVRARLTGRYDRVRRLKMLALTATVAAIVSGGWYWAHLPHRPTAAAQAAADNARVKRENVTREGFLDALDGFRRAIELDPQWSQAWAELAYTYAAGANSKHIPAATASIEARTAALKAIQLDDRSPKAFGALGWVQSLDLNDWPQAEANLRRAVELDPADHQVRYWLGVYLRKKGNFAGAEVETREALNLSRQQEPSYWCELAFLYWTFGRLDRMNDLMQELLVAHPNYGLTRFLNARLLKEQGRYEAALRELEVSAMLQYATVGVMAERASIEAYRGNSVAALKILDELTELSKAQPIDSLLIAGVYARLNDFDSAFESLEAGFARHDNTMLSVATSPVLAPLRRDPRFTSLLERLHFSP
jgi:tetratricopeptide (TPR) repeat protein